MSRSEVPKKQPNIVWALIIYIGYLAVFFTIWYINGVDYLNISENAETVKLWYAYPTLFGSAFVILIISYLGWWRPVLFDKSTAKPVWVWVFPLLIVALIIIRLVNTNFSEVSHDFLIWVIMGGVGVGLGEEIITRGSLLFALRSKCSEGRVWLYSTLLFSALHIPNVFFGLASELMLMQLILTFIMGSGLYVIRRISGTLILPIILHGLWDSSLFLSQTSEVSLSILQVIIYPVAIVCIIAILRKKWNEKLV